MLLNSRIIGENPKSENHLIILHGLYGNSDSWLRIARIIEKENKYIIHLPDIRNHGKSFHSTEHNYDAMTEDLKEYIDHNDISKAYIVGHSMGGKLAMFFAKKFPEHIKKMVVADIAPGNYKSLTDYDSRANFHLNLISLFKSFNPEKHKTYREFERSANIKDEAIKNLVLKNLKKESGQLKWKLNLDAILNNLDNILDGLNPDDFIDKKIKNEILFLKGEKSDYIQSNDEKLISFIFPNSRISQIPGAGHWLNVEQPEKVAEVIISFLQE